jgi:adenylate kinase
MDTPRTFIFFGLSGGGKGTQAKLLETYLSEKDTDREVVHLSTGDLFRNFIKNDTYTSGKVKDILDEGGLLPAFLPIWIWTSFLNDKVKNNNEHFIFDGMARRANEAPVLDGALRFYGRNENTDVVVINVSREWSTMRLKERGRYDDNDEDIKARLDWFEENVVPSINYFRENKNYRVHEINGEQSIEGVQKELWKELKI